MSNLTNSGAISSEYIVGKPYSSTARIPMAPSYGGSSFHNSGTLLQLTSSQRKQQIQTKLTTAINKDEKSVTSFHVQGCANGK